MDQVLIVFILLSTLLEQTSTKNQSSLYTEFFFQIYFLNKRQKLFEFSHLFVKLFGIKIFSGLKSVVLVFKLFCEAFPLSLKRNNVGLLVNLSKGFVFRLFLRSLKRINDI